MDKFTTLTGVAAPLPIDNIDTDMIIPKQYLKTIKRTGLGAGLFSEMRYREDGSENPDFVLNKPAYRKASIIVAGDNFGCGSSREHAPWALLDFGVRCVIATDFADIFYNNCFKNGVLPIKVSRGGSRQAHGRRRARRERDADHRSAGAGDPRPRRRRRQVRDRPVPQALPDRGARRHRPHPGRRRRRSRRTKRRPPPPTPGGEGSRTGQVEPARVTATPGSKSGGSEPGNESAPRASRIAASP